MEDAPPDFWTVMSWPDPNEGPWAVRVHWRDFDGRDECIGLDLWSGTAIEGGELQGRVPSPITATSLRELKPDSLITTARRKRRQGLEQAVEAGHRYLAEENRKVGRGQTTVSPYGKGRRVRQDPALGPPQTADLRNNVRRLAEARRWPDGSKPRGRPAGKAWPEEHWNEVATAYRTAWAAGFNPTAEVSAQFNVGYSTASTWISRCRTRGLLSPTKQGKAGTGPREQS
jgi:hypothetical protein